MARTEYPAREAAQRLGISLDTLRRWDQTGKITTRRDSRNRRVVSAEEIERLRGDAGSHVLSARNRFVGTVTSVEIEGLIAKVEIVVDEPARVVALVTRDAVEDLALAPGMSVTALVKSTSVMVER